jgi:hypothetical protein
MCSGQAQRGELSLYERGGALMCKMIAWLPRKTGEGHFGTLYVRSAADCLLVATNQKEETVWRWNADHVRRWRAEHRKQLQRWSEDQKTEQRPVPDFQPRREASSQRFHARMATAADQAAAYVANYAKRRRFAAIEYNDSDKSYCEDFVWFRMRDRLKVLLDEYGIEFHTSSKPPEGNEGALADVV